MSTPDREALPPLPEPFEVWTEDEPNTCITGFTADQMREYGRLSAERILEQDRLGDPTDRSGYRRVPVVPTPQMIEAAVHALDGQNLSKMSARERARHKALVRWYTMLDVAPTTPQQQTALQRFHEINSDGPDVLSAETPLERLRFFCSLAMKAQDWIDVESFFDACEAEAQSDNQDRGKPVGA